MNSLTAGAKKRVFGTAGERLAGAARAFERAAFVFAVAALIAAAFMHRHHWAPLLLPQVKHVQLQGRFIHIDRLEVEQLVQNALGEHFFDADLHALKLSLEALPWVRRARVARVWPQTLHVEIEEHDAVARWGVDALLSAEGEVFRPAERPADAGLPLLYASSDAAPTALSRYRRARELLAGDDGAGIKAFGEDRRGSWRLLLDNGVLVKVGDGDWDARFRRFAAAWSGGLSAQATRIRCVDLRYPDGFAVAWKDRSGSCE